VRFVLDQNVDARLGRVFRTHGHECWPVGRANLALAADDELTAYAYDKDAVMVTHDVEFSQRRARNAIGKHLQLRCEEPDAVELVTLHFDAIIANLKSGEHVFVQVSADGCTRSMRWS
jgi:predicted nuclease of predicted toxin-antitoxin system